MSSVNGKEGRGGWIVQIVSVTAADLNPFSTRRQPCRAVSGGSEGGAEGKIFNRGHGIHLTTVSGVTSPPKILNISF